MGNFWTGGITNPLEVIEQFTYLLFIKGLDDKETTNENEALFLGIDFQGLFPQDKQNLRWSKFKDFEAGEMYKTMQEEVFPFIKNLHGDADSAYAKYMGDAIFKIPTPLMLSKIVDGINNIDMEGEDTKGDLYEYLLSKVATAGTNGQFRTPRHIIDMMVKLMKPKPEDVFRPIDITGGKRPKRSELKMTTEEISNQYKRTLLSGNELLLTVRGNVGDVLVIDEEFKGCNVGRNITPIRVNTEILNIRFLEHLLKSPGINGLLKQMSKVSHYKD